MEDRRLNLTKLDEETINPSDQFLALGSSMGVFIENYRGKMPLIKPVFINVCDCLAIIVSFKQGTFFLHKFRKNSAKDIKENLYKIFRKYNISQDDLLRITMFGGVISDEYVVKNDDKLKLVYSDKEEEVNFDQLSQIWRHKLQRRRSDRHKYEAGAIRLKNNLFFNRPIWDENGMNIFFNTPNIESRDICMDISNDEGQNVATLVANNRNPKTDGVGIFNFTTFMAAMIDALKHIQKSEIQSPDEILKKTTHYLTKAGENIIFDEYRDTVYFATCDLKCVEFTEDEWKIIQQTAQDGIDVNFNEDEDINNSDLCQKIEVLDISYDIFSKFYTNKPKELEAPKNKKPRKCKCVIF